MKTRFCIKIKKRTLAGWLSWLLMLAPLFLGILTEFLKFPWATRYLLDVAWVSLTVIMMRNVGRIKWHRKKIFVLWIMLFAVVSFLVYLVQYQSGWFYLWGVRNNFRFYIAFLSFSVALSINDIEDFFDVFDVLFWINLIVSFVQWVLIGVNGDYLGGIFGVSQGVNGYSNIFILIAVTRSICFYLDQKETIKKCACKCVAAFLIAAMAEIKFFYVEFIVIVVFAVLLSNFTWRKLWIIVGSVAALLLFTTIMAVFFPTSAELLSFEWFQQEATSNKGYTSSGDLNRLTAISRINELWLTHWSQRIFGMGLGNCDTSSFAIVNTPFYEQWGHMHYTWMSYAIMYLECGWVGLIFYFGFFVLVYLQIQKIEKRSEGVARSYCRISKIMAILCPLIAVYNSSLRAESAYMAYFVLAIPFVYARSGQTKGTQMKKRENEIPLKG